MATLSTNQTKLRQIERSRHLAAAMQQMASSFEPITHPYQGLAKLAQAYVAASTGNIASRREKEYEEGNREALAEALGPQYGTVPGRKPADDGGVPLGDVAGVLQGYNPQTGQVPPVGAGQLGPVGYQGERQVQTSPGVPQQQIDQIMALPPAIRNTVVGNYVQSQLLPPDADSPKSAETFATVGPNGYLTDHRSAVPGTPEYEQLVRSPDHVRVGLPTGIERVEQGGPGEFGMTQSQFGKQQIAINDQVAAMNTFAKGTERLLGIMRENPGANTLVAQMANIGHRAITEVKTLVNSLGVEFERGDEAWNIDNYADVFKANGLAGASPRIKNGFLAMAIQRAMGSGLGTGRALSDYDIKNQLATLGANQSNPDIVATIFADSYMNLRDYTISKYEPYKNELKLPELYQPGYINIVPVQQLEGWADLTPAEQASLQQAYPNGYRMQ
jgi:hypothetical protein